jgi:hypothetical protein
VFFKDQRNLAFCKGSFNVSGMERKGTWERNIGKIIHN